MLKKIIPESFFHLLDRSVLGWLGLTAITSSFSRENVVSPPHSLLPTFFWLRQPGLGPIFISIGKKTPPTFVYNLAFIRSFNCFQCYHFVAPEYVHGSGQNWSVLFLWPQFGDTGPHYTNTRTSTQWRVREMVLFIVTLCPDQQIIVNLTERPDKGRISVTRPLILL